ncbi:Phosphoinositide 3-kinase adapter protein 1 [Merluccius polli]|uniref:Phosphoinositide 3-kinase adapter protein 1 n=1 Tax=Merluccius polli TaxID=89951 RepID=A0AA47P751_MERPO|nr:Phosphoinositide 3-kinase adapter protein 1 [Merluccius polli]
MFEIFVSADVNTSSVPADSSSGCELLILHTAEAREWADYFHQVLKSSRTFRKHSVFLYAVSQEDRLHGYNFEYFHRSKCIVLLLTTTLLDVLRGDEELHRALQRLLQPPRRVVALLCGVSEECVPVCSFQDWPSWSKLHTEDEPAIYISTVLEAMADRKQDEADSKREAPETPVTIKAANSSEEPDTEEYVSADEGEPELIVDVSSRNSPQQKESSDQCSTCLTIQPNRILCGERTTIYIILLHKVDIQSKTEVEFSSGNVAGQHVPACIHNEYTISVTAPDMPAGLVSLTLFSDHSSVSLTPVMYYTSMDEVSRNLENAISPIEFICQAFNITFNKTESLDNMLTDLLKSRMPVGGLQVFGIQQIETNNMSAYQRNEDLPTLLHFAARHGLKNLTTALLHCPGALQAYSVMNKQGDYPNTLAERSGFTDLRQFMDTFVENQIQDEDSGGVYEIMVASSEDINTYPDHTEDIYESMLGINPECADDLYEVMTGVAENQNTEEAMLRKFFQANPGAGQSQDKHLETEDIDKVSQNNVVQYEEEEKEEEEEDDNDDLENGIYHTFSEDVYDVIDDIATYSISAINRAPAPIPRPENSLDSNTYISREPVYKTYCAVKTPGQRQLIVLQERVKMGIIDVNEAVQEFQTWQLDQRRSNSLRCQKENLNRLRNSITRRHKEMQKLGKNYDLEITAPIHGTNVCDSEIAVEYSLYDSTPRVSAPPPAVSCPMQRGTWKTGSTSSTSRLLGYPASTATTSTANTRPLSQPSSPA